MLLPSQPKLVNLKVVEMQDKEPKFLMFIIMQVLCNAVGLAVLYFRFNVCDPYNLLANFPAVVAVWLLVLFVTAFFIFVPLQDAV